MEALRRSSLGIWRANGLHNLQGHLQHSSIVLIMLARSTALLLRQDKGAHRHHNVGISEPPEHIALVGPQRLLQLPQRAPHLHTLPGS